MKAKRSRKKRILAEGKRRAAFGPLPKAAGGIKRMTRSQMIAQVAEQTDLPADTEERVMDGVFGTITEC